MTMIEEEINTKKNIKNKKSKKQENKKQENKKQEISIQSNNIIRENSGSIIFGSEKERYINEKMTNEFIKSCAKMKEIEKTYSIKPYFLKSKEQYSTIEELEKMVL